MGTNYYILEPNKDYDVNCPIKSKTEPKYVETHLGKSSGGWCFSLHVYPNEEIKTLDDWIKIMQDYDSKNNLIIIDEYGANFTLQQFLDVVRNRKSDRTWEHIEKEIEEQNFIYRGFSSLQDLLHRNHAEKGPNNLLRSKINGNHCIGHGEGTWDYKIGDFS